MTKKTNRVMLADSYKYSQPFLYPKGMNYMYDYMEARGGKYNKVVFCLLQHTLIKYLTDPITAEEVVEAASNCAAHGEPFDYEGWMYIVRELNGKLPIIIKAIPEGTIVPTGVPLLTIESTEAGKKVPWIVSWLETLILKLWYPITVATKTMNIIEQLRLILRHSSDNEDPSFMLHNFGDRGASSVESAAIGGLANLIPARGTDNFNAISYGQEFYNAVMPGYSIPATEHSNVTSWGRDKEFDFYTNYVESYKYGSKLNPIIGGKPKFALIASVKDSYDVFKAVYFATTGELKDKIESDEYPIYVMRPDSGNPLEIVPELISIMEKNNVAYKVNSKTLKVFLKYKLIWGDGICPEMIEKLCQLVISLGYSPDILAFGSGGDLMQKVNRDQAGMAIKCSYIEKAVDGVTIGVDVFKEPITDKFKKSKAGKVTTFKDTENNYFVGQVDNTYESAVEALEEVYYNGQIIKYITWDEVINNYLKSIKG